MGHVFGTDQTLIRETLRNKTPEQRQAIAAAYKKLYGKELLVDFAWELRGDDHAVAYALWEGNTEKADAIEIKIAREGLLGTGPREDREGLHPGPGRGDPEGRCQGPEDRGDQRRDRPPHRQDGERVPGLHQARPARRPRELVHPGHHGIWDPVQRENVKQYWAGRRDLVMGHGHRRPGARRRGQDPDRAHRVLRQGRDHQQGARAAVLAGLRQRPPGRCWWTSRPRTMAAPPTRRR